MRNLCFKNVCYVLTNLKDSLKMYAYLKYIDCSRIFATTLASLLLKERCNKQFDIAEWACHCINMAIVTVDIIMVGTMT